MSCLLAALGWEVDAERGTTCSDLGDCSCSLLSCKAGHRGPDVVHFKNFNNEIETGRTFCVNNFLDKDVEFKVLFKTCKESCQLTNSAPAIFVMQNDMEPSKAVPLNAAKQDGPVPKPHSVSLNDTETRKLMEECKRLQGEMMKLSEENRHLRVSVPMVPAVGDGLDTLLAVGLDAGGWRGLAASSVAGAASEFLAWSCRLQQQCRPREGPPLPRAVHLGVLSWN